MVAQSGPRVTPRVLQLVLSLNPGGTERLVVEMVRRFRREIPMAVCCLDEEGIWADELKAEGTVITALRRPPGFVPGLARAVAAAASRHRANIVHCHHYSPFVYGALARVWRPAMQVVFTEHGRLSDAAPSPKRRLANKALRLAPRHVCAVSEDLRTHLVAEGFSRDAVQVIYNGISIGPLPGASERRQVRQDLGLGEDTLVVATIARLDPVKDLGTLIRAIESLDRELPVTLLIVGDGPERPALEKLAIERGVQTRVRFLGHRNDARRWLAAADVYVNTSISEGVSLTILEAMAAGLPVVATAVGGTPEIVTRECGRLVPARDIASLSEVVGSLGKAPALRQAMGRSARSRAETFFTLERMIDEYRTVYHRVA